jgi:Pentose-5-phosphate-3-epimerase
MTRVAPSILSADFTRLGEEIISIKESDCDWIHFDVMDGLFVPNITFGIPVLKSVRRFTEMFLDVHLMINNPQNLAAEFCDAGANLLNAHIEATDLDGINSFLRIVKEHDKLSALSIKPSTPLNSIIPFLTDLICFLL